MKHKSYNILFEIFSYLSDLTNGAPFIVKYKLLFGTLIIGLTNNISAKDQEKEIVSYTTHFEESILDEIIGASPSVSLHNKKDSINVRGYVKDSIGEAIIGAHIKIKNSSNGTITNLNGYFTLNAKLDDILVFSMFGFYSQEISVSEIENSIIVVMKENNVDLSNSTNVVEGTYARKQILPIANVNTEVSIPSNLKPDSTLRWPDSYLSEAISGILCYGIVADPYHNDDIYIPRYRERNIRVSYDAVRDKPISPVGNLESFQKWVQENVNNSEGIKGEVIVSFVVDKKGKIVEKRIVRGLSKEINKEVLNVISKSKKWKPAKLDGKFIETTIDVTIKFDGK